ncbi:MAG: class I SAM-dependent methyltransferase [Cryomorphaceae bacterium]
MNLASQLSSICASSTSRTELVSKLALQIAPKTVAEIGVYKGDMAEPLLRACPSIEKYIMIDPWRNLSDWNKPANREDDTFEQIYAQTMERTAFASEKRVVLRGKTTEVIVGIEDQSLDMVYIDGDHTLKGITIDLLRVLPKMKSTGWIVGDDLIPSIWQHNLQFEPTMVFPLALHFAEGINRKIFLLPFNQFALQLDSDAFEVIDLSGLNYAETDLLPQIKKLVDEAVLTAGIKSRLIRSNPKLYGVYRSFTTLFRSS